MWFCSSCRLIVERNIVTDLKIEERCREIMEHYEKRISTLEDKVNEKCDEETVRRIVSLEIDKVEAKANKVKDTEGEDDPLIQKETIQEEVINEINERKAREKNIVIYGSAEEFIENSKERREADRRTVEEIFQSCDIESSEVTVTKVIRIGKYKKDEETEEDERPRKRPILVTLENPEMKATIFKKISNLNETKYSDIRVANDLSAKERENEKKLYEEAQRKNTMVSGDYHFKVRGPPWARRVVRVKKIT